MSSVQVDRVGETYIVSRRFEVLPAAMRAAELLGSVVEAAFDPVPGSVDEYHARGGVRQDTGD